MNKKNIPWIIQFSIGTIMIFCFIWIGRIYENINSNLDTGIIIGVGGMLLFWGVREIFGALRNQYKLVFANEVKSK